MDNIGYCEHVLKTIARDKQRPVLWKVDEFQTVRECVSIIASRPDLYPMSAYDRMPDSRVPGKSRFEGGWGKKN